MFSLHTALAIQLLALIAAAGLLAWSGHTHIFAKGLVRGVAYSVMVISVLGILCTGYYGVKYSRAGYFDSPMGMHGMMHEGMMKKKGMKGGNMMEDMMGGDMRKGAMDNASEPGAATPPESETPHSHEHGE